ncbi:MAG: amino acid ABC transporter substrate-binding protein [Rhodospirillaceae bacterium]|nr:amino acid ABC transporter substrate-binding protein [Rhodospirillaceae bacterium]
MARRSRRRMWALGLTAAAGLALAGTALAVPPKTLEAGKLKVALNGDMPMTSIKDGKLIGTDGELVVLMAERLGLTVEPQLMEWSAEIQSTKQCKVDVMHGAMGWIPDRAKIMLLTDPIYYFGTLLAQKKANNWSTFADMKGRSVGTVTGFTLVPELKGVEGIGEVKLYDTTDGVLRDLTAGRLDMAILDPPLMELYIQQHPEADLHQVPLVPEPDKYPIMSTKYNVVIGVCPEEKELYEALNKQIAKAWDACENVKLMAKYGLSDKSWFTPPPDPNPRNGVDRPADWKAPTGEHCFQ